MNTKLLFLQNNENALTTLLHLVDETQTKENDDDQIPNFSTIQIKGGIYYW